MVYPHDSNIDNITAIQNGTDMNEVSKANYVKNTKIYGDAIREISKEAIGNTSWKNDYSYFLSLGSPFTIRGGSLWDNIYAGNFSFGRNYGGNKYSDGFRAVIVPIS